MLACCVKSLLHDNCLLHDMKDKTFGSYKSCRCAISRYPFNIEVINIHCINVHYIFSGNLSTTYYTSIFIECCSSLRCDKAFRSSCRFACQHRFSISVRMFRLHDHLTDSVKARLYVAFFVCDCDAENGLCGC